MRGASKVARKVPTNVSVRGDLVARAKQLGLNLSGMLEAAIEDAIRVADRARWLADNDEAIDAYNVRVAQRGVFGDGWRKF